MLGGIFYQRLREKETHQLNRCMHDAQINRQVGTNP
jgi:hypothetical protein